MPAKTHPLTLDRPATYRIQVPGVLVDHWLDWDARCTVEVEHDPQGRPVTNLTGVFDQAALHSLLRRLYALGMPLLLVQFTGTETTADQEDAA